MIVDILQELLNKYGSIDVALTVYNRGSDDGNREYAERVMEEMK